MGPTICTSVLTAPKAPRPGQGDCVIEYADFKRVQKYDIEKGKNGHPICAEVILLDDTQLLLELNKIMTLEHGHLGMYRDFDRHQDQDMRRTFRRFAEVEEEHIQKIKNVILNMGGKVSLLAEGGDILGKLFGITINLGSDHDLIKTFSFIEKKSHEGYQKFVTKLEQDQEKRSQLIAEIASSNMLEAWLMHLWLEDKMKKI